MAEYGTTAVEYNPAEVAANTKTEDELVAIAVEIVDRVRGSGVDARDDAGNDRLYEELRRAYPDFAAAFPIVLRWTVQVRQFRVKAFRRYLRRYKAQTAENAAMGRALWSTRQAFLESQADYMATLCRELHPRWGAQQVGEYRRAILKQLTDEDEEFKRMAEQADADVKRMEEEAREDLRRRLYEALTDGRLAEARRLEAAGEVLAAGPRPTPTVAERLGEAVARAEK